MFLSMLHCLQLYIQGLFRRWHFDTKDQVKEKCLAVFPLTFLRVQVAVDRQCLKILGVFDQTHLAV